MPEQLRVLPGDIASGDDRPHRYRLVGCVRGDVLDVGDQPRVKPSGDLRLNRCEQAINALVIAVHDATVLRCKTELLTRGEDGDRQVVIDVRHHAGKRELDRLARLRASLHQRTPRQRTRPARSDRRLCIEVQGREHDIQTLNEPWFSKSVPALAASTARVTCR